MQFVEHVFTMSGQIRRFLARPLFLLMVIACLLPGTTMLAQLAGKGAISGIVDDPTGAAIPNAKVTATNTATGVSVTTASTNAGDYAFSTLDPGGYTIKVESSGVPNAAATENVNVNALWKPQPIAPKLTVGSSLRDCNRE